MPARTCRSIASTSGCRARGKPPSSTSEAAMSVNPADSAITRDLFGTEAMRRLFGDEERLAAMLQVEAALARVEARLGLIPATAADAITASAKVSNLDVPAIAA